MGSPVAEAGRADDEGLHKTCIDAFFLGKTEVTVGQFHRFVQATGYRTQAEATGGCWTYEAGELRIRAQRNWRNPGFSQSEAHPVVCVSWNDASAYLNWLNQKTGLRYRLPTEEEWEYAARAGTRTARPWGADSENACRYANVADLTTKQTYREWEWPIHQCDGGVANTARVGRYDANEWGLHDMLGNVWEWTCSSYDRNYVGDQSRCGTDDARALRGGSWSNAPELVRSAVRAEDKVGNSSSDLGFRLARD